MKKEDYVIVRTNSAGVFAGYFKSREGEETTLTEARRIWYWDGAASLSQLAVEGTSKPGTCRFPAPVPEVTVRGTIEIITTTKKSEESIKSVPVWRF